MPRLRANPIETENRTIIAKIRYGMELYDISPDDLALAMRTSTKTVYCRFKHPEGFRIAELRAVAGKLHTTVQDLFQKEST